MKLFVSALFLSKIFTMLSKNGSMHLLRKRNISPNVIKAIFERDDLNESAIFKIVEVSPLITVPWESIILLWCLHNLLMIEHASN